jgi:hypothetical protein
MPLRAYAPVENLRAKSIVDRRGRLAARTPMPTARVHAGAMPEASLQSFTQRR